MPLNPGRDERGFAMVTVIGVMLIVVTLVFATMSLADGDQVAARQDNDRRTAYAAAEAGIQNYLFHLVQDNDYWTKCTDVKEPSAVNQRWNKVGADTRTKRISVPGSPSSYVLELLPANGSASCVKNSSATMIDKATGTFRIRSTGRAKPGGLKRSIVSTFRRQSFLNFIYFTDLETQDPAVYFKDALGLQTKENPRTSPLTQRNIVQWATEACGTTYWYKNRAALQFLGNHFDSRGRRDTGIFDGDTWSSYAKGCGEIQFRGPTTSGGSVPDIVDGPIHTNDEFLVCGFPEFGRNPQDTVETSGPGRALTAGETPATVGWRANTANGCPSTSKPKVNFTTTGSGLDANLGIWRPNAPTLDLPPSNTTLKADTAAAYRFKGRTKITFDGDGYMHVIGTLENGTVYAAGGSGLGVRIKVPTDGVVYIANGSCGATYNPLAPYGTTSLPIPAGCGNAEIKGSYVDNVTIAAENDVIVMDDLKRVSGNTTALMGLIPNNFVRVYHPVTNLDYDDANNRYTCTNNGSVQGDGTFTIDAAILSLAHSFIVDNFYCGNPLGSLKVTGAIAQKFRGPVGTGSGTSIDTGYSKNYQYDDELRFRSPPKFLDPVQASWQVQLYTEQVPAT